MLRNAASVVVSCLLLLTAAAFAGDVYSNGPINGTSDAWTINFGFILGNTFTVSTPNTPITQLSFGAWLFPGDTLESAEVSLTSDFDGGTTYFDQVVNFTQSGRVRNQYGYNVCTETGSFNGPALSVGTYWVNLQNAVVNTGDPVYWDENDGIGCSSPGCPSQGFGNNCIGDGEGCVGSESFTLSSNSGATVPEPSSVLILSSGGLIVVGRLRLRFRWTPFSRGSSQFMNP
jgi:hypothetical protein